MSLFVINRYEGEDNKEEVKKDRTHLIELLQRIEERKQQREQNLKRTEAPNGLTIGGQQVKRLKKEHKNDADVSNRLSSELCQEDGVLPEEKGKKKKKKSGVIEECSTNESVNVTNDNTQGLKGICQLDDTIIKKKRKRKKQKKQPDDKDKVDADGQNQEDSKLDLNNKNNLIETNFTILGAKTKKKTREVKRILPYWLAHPEIISADLHSGPSLEEMISVLDPKLINTLMDNGIVKLFPVQSALIKWIIKCDNDRNLGLWPRDTCVSAPTGSGKTLAYVLPIVQQLQTRFVPKIRCLMVLPVEELAAQVYKVTQTYASCTKLKVALLSGASSFEQEQLNLVHKTARGEYISQVDIVVATPGRLLDHILKTTGFSLDSLKFLVIDEADRATNWMQFLPECHIQIPPLTKANMSSRTVPPAQKLLFSATLSQDPEKLNRLGLFQPVLYTSVIVSDRDDDVDLDKEKGEFIGRYTTPEGLIELAVECIPQYKPIAIYELLSRYSEALKVLIFTNSKETVHRLSLLLQTLLSDKNITVGELSAQLIPQRRKDVLDKFTAGEIDVLISSDALARGLDIPDVELVISYDLPKYIKGYIHRCGRTGRAGKPGTAITIVRPKQVGIFKQMLSGAHKTIPTIEKMDVKKLADSIDYESHVERLRQTLNEEKVKMLRKMKPSNNKHIGKVHKKQNYTEVE